MNNNGIGRESLVHCYRKFYLLRLLVQRFIIIFYKIYGVPKVFEYGVFLRQMIRIIIHCWFLPVNLMSPRSNFTTNNRPDQDNQFQNDFIYHIKSLILILKVA